jgi:hypothetical protein
VDGTNHSYLARKLLLLKLSVPHDYVVVGVFQRWHPPENQEILRKIPSPPLHQ